MGSRILSATSFGALFVLKGGGDWGMSPIALFDKVDMSAIVRHIQSLATATNVP